MELVDGTARLSSLNPLTRARLDDSLVDLDNLPAPEVIAPRSWQI